MQRLQFFWYRSVLASTDCLHWLLLVFYFTIIMQRNIICRSLSHVYKIAGDYNPVGIVPIFYNPNSEKGSRWSSSLFRWNGEQTRGRLGNGSWERLISDQGDSISNKRYSAFLKFERNNMFYNEYSILSVYDCITFIFFE